MFMLRNYGGMLCLITNCFVIETVRLQNMFLSYPKAHEPDYIIPNEYSQYRFAIGKKGTSPLVAICMNPSAARDTESDLTINRIIGVSRSLGFDGWMVFNTYPERATNAKNSIVLISTYQMRIYLLSKGFLLKTV